MVFATLFAVLSAGLVVTPSWSELAAKIRSDPPPDEITRGRHYVRSDELRHDLFRSHIDNEGGIFIGVGTNQNYLMAAWARPQVLVIVDFDQVVVNVHEAYRALFLHAESPADFISLWQPNKAARRRAFAYIDATFSDRPRRLVARRALKEWGARVHKGLLMTLEAMQEQKQSCFLDDAGQFAFLKSLFAEDRVLTIRGDFTGGRTVKDIARAAEAAGLVVRVLYLSNVEQYIGWERPFRRNMLALPFDERSQVLRTYGWGTRRTADHNYRYYVQSGTLFREWLRAPHQSYVHGLLATAKPSTVVGFDELTAPPAITNRTEKESPPHEGG